MAIDLFVSYSSKDRPWAEKLYRDLKVSYPWLRVFYDRETIPAGANWRQELTNAIRDSKHLLVFWSKNADTPNASGVKEVDPEIADFLAHRNLVPKLEGSTREVFYVPLDIERGGGIADSQGFPGLKGHYKPNDADLGVSNLNINTGLEEWRFMIRKVGDAISNADSAQPVIAAIIATSQERLPLLDAIHSLHQHPDGPTLDEFLQGFGLTWAGVRDRYGQNALDWRPRGDQTIVTMLDEVRIRVNAQLEANDRFRWRFVDLASNKPPGQYAANIMSVYKNLSAVVFDPISLYDTYYANALHGLEEYVRKREAVMISLSPVLQTNDDLGTWYLRSVSSPILEDYFQPKVPPKGEFVARCALDVQRTSQIEPLIRHRIRYPYILIQEKADREIAKETTGQK